MLEDSVDFFMNHTKRKFSNNLKIVLMMPPNTAAGIIDYCINWPNNPNKFLSLYRNNIIQSTNGSKLKKAKLDKSLCKQLANNTSGSPDFKRFLNAIK